MGEFVVTLTRGSRVVEEFAAPNTLHEEGCDYALRRMFPISGAFAPARNDIKLCIGGLNCLGTSKTPNGTLNAGLPYDRHTTFAEITTDLANEGGAFGNVHAAILGYDRQPVSFDVVDQGRSAVIQTQERSFVNAIPWSPLGEYGPDEFEPPDFGWPAWKPVHRYPWDKPTWKPDHWGSSGVSGAWSDMLTNNPATGATFSVGVAFIVSLAPSPILMCSARFTRCLVIRPGDELHVRYAGRVRAGGFTTSTFAKLLARGAWANDVGAEPSDFRAALATNAPASLDQSAMWTDIVEPDGQASPGYTQVALTDWTKGNNACEVVAQCAGFHNNSADETWQTVHWFCVLADFAGSTVLCWLEPINAPAELNLGPDDRISLPDGVRFALRDNHD